MSIVFLILTNNFVLVYEAWGNNFKIEISDKNGGLTINSYLTGRIYRYSVTLMYVGV